MTLAAVPRLTFPRPVWKTATILLPAAASSYTSLLGIGPSALWGFLKHAKLI